MSKNKYKNKNKHYKPLEEPPDKKAQYKTLLAWTRSKLTYWYISDEGPDFTEYKLQGKDGHNIYLTHYYNRPEEYAYKFTNFPGHYTISEYRALEKAICDAGLKKPLTPTEYREKIRLERKKKEEKIQRYKEYWHSLKDATENDRCIWIFFSVSEKSRSFRTLFKNHAVTFFVKLDVGKNEPIYHIKSDHIKETLSIGPTEGKAFEQALLKRCRYTQNIRRIPECHNRTAIEYRNFLIQQRIVQLQAQKKRENEQKERIRIETRRINNELRSILLKEYRMPDGSNKMGIEVLAADSSGELLEAISDRALPAVIKLFASNIDQVLNCIESGYGNNPDIKKLYSSIMDAFANKYVQKSAVLPDKTIKKYASLLKELQKKIKEFPQEDYSQCENNNSEKTEKVNKESRGKRVNAHDFVIRSNVLSCMYKQHTIVNVDAVIQMVDKKQTFSEIIVPAGYCQQCQKFFVLESDFAQIATKGELLCTVINEQQYKKNYRNDSYFNDLSAWPEKSILGKCGYNVNKTTGLTVLERRKILANIIDREVLSKIEIKSHLQKQIALHARHLQAIDKWESDIDFVTGYNKGYYSKYGVSKLRL